jgi:SAM-dependent methyltransferase
MLTARRLFVLLSAIGAAVAWLRHDHGASGGHSIKGGILMRDAAAYDSWSHRLVLGSLLRRIAADIATVAPAGARVLEVGCGPGRLSLRLARSHGFDVTGLDLDPAMIERARANAGREGDGARRPSFVVGDVTELTFPDETFDLVVSTLSMHHWADPAAGLAEIARVLRPGGRAFVWDFRSGAVPLHPRMPDPVQIHDSPLRLVSVTPWRWPWRFSLTQRIELVRADEVSDPAGR